MLAGAVISDVLVAHNFTFPWLSGYVARHFHIESCGTFGAFRALRFLPDYSPLLKGLMTRLTEPLAQRCFLDVISLSIEAESVGHLFENPHWITLKPSERQVCLSAFF
jgi:hypothetical protein